MQTHFKPESPVVPKLAVSTFQAAEISGIGRTEIYKAIQSGDLRSLKIGKRRLIRLSALDEWLAGKET